MIKTSQQLGEDIPDGKDPQALRDYIIQLKLTIEELSRKAQPMQIELRTSVPGVNDLDEGEIVRHTNNNIYTKLNGVIRVIATA